MKRQNQFVQAMKCCLTNGKFALLLFGSILLLTSCGNDLSRSKAEKMIKEFYQFPVVQSFDIDWNYRQEDKKRKILENIQSKGLIVIYQDNTFGSNITYNLTESGKKYVLSQHTNSWLNTVNHFVTNCYVFNEITGIIVNEQNKTAKVNWTGKRIGITPFGEYYDFKENDVVPSETNFVLFDDGWRIDDKKFKKIEPTSYSFFNTNGEYIGTN